MEKLLSPDLGIASRRSFKDRWRAMLNWCRRVWQDVRPGPETKQGTFWAILLTVLWVAVVGALNLKLGFGIAVDFLIALAIAVIGIPLVALLVALVMLILRRLPLLLSGFVVGSFVFLSLLWGNPIGYGFALILVLVEGTLGACLATLLFGHFKSLALTRRVITIVLFTGAILANALLFGFLHSEGVNEKVIREAQNTSAVPQLTAQNPALPGHFAVKTLFYGAGDDIRRPEYGKSVAIRTATVDASRFFKDFKPWKANLRKMYWGFGMDKLPLNARVWYPAGPGPFPLVLIVHGNHDMAEFSDPGYAYLGELLASRGFIMASIDENFLNSGLFMDPPKQQPVRGWLLLEHLKLWHKWNTSSGNPFFGKVDLQNVALMGHSRGGEAAATAVLFNKLSYYPDDATIQFHYGFPIKSVVAIAPPDGQYKPAGEWRIIQDVNYFTIQGANDADVSSFQGSRQWDHVHYTGAGAYFKAELFIGRANHGQFNTAWGRSDVGSPDDWFLNLHPLLSGEDQRRIAKTYISAFLEATLHDRSEYVPLFENDRRARNWLPHTLYVYRFLNSTDKVISDFSEDADLTTTTVPGGHLLGQNLGLWHEGRIPFRSGDRAYNGVFLGWNRAQKISRNQAIPAYSIELPDSLGRDWNVDGRSVLNLSLAVSEAEPPVDEDDEPEEKKETKKELKSESDTTDFNIDLESQDGVRVSLPLSRFGVLLPPFKIKFTKLEFLDKQMYKSASEPIFQTFDLPLRTFAGVNPRFDPAKLKRIRLRFDRTPARVIILSAVGLEKLTF